ncbi:hypothetical protein PENSPDRAFT_282181 [Peniophora sp. CONT]|nr:hypothetical protein PENSPDRAFT_282181 [Peniophora sp. CONT]
MPRHGGSVGKRGKSAEITADYLATASPTVCPAYLVPLGSPSRGTYIPLQWWREARSAWTHIVIGPGAGAGGRNQDAENAN